MLGSGLFFLSGLSSSADFSVKSASLFNRKRRTSDAMNLTPTKRDSDVKEWPHILKGTPRQTTPQLYMEMENYEELGYTSYHNNPGVFKWFVCLFS